MPNLAGAFDMRPSPTDTGEIAERLVRVLMVKGVDYSVRKWSDNRFVAVNLLNGICGNLDQPACTPRADHILFLDGEVYNLPEACRVEEDEGRSVNFGSPAGMCLRLYEILGNDFVTRLSGQFNILIYDRERHVVKVFNDRLAYRPFYYWCANGLGIFGLEKKAIFAALGRTPALDPMGTLQFFAFGHNLDDRTLFSGVQAMPQGSVLAFKGGQAEFQRYWQPKFTGRARPRSVAECAHQMADRLCTAVARQARVERKYGIFLSGGLDSRAAGAALSRVRRGVASFTFGQDDSPDLIYGRQLASELGFEYHRLRYDDVSLAEILPRVVWRTEGSISFHQTPSVVHHGQIRAKAAVILNGHMGDVISGSTTKRPEQYLAWKTRQLARHIVQKRTLLPISVLQTIFNRAFLDEAHTEMVTGLERSLEMLEEDRLPLVRLLWDMTVRQRRSTFSSPAAERYILETVTPFTDNDVIDWMLTMPFRYLFGQRVYKRMIVETFPEIAHVPWTTTGRPVCTNVLADSGVLLWLFLKSRARRIAGRGVRPIALYGHAEDLKTYVDERLSLDTFTESIFDRDGVSRVIRAALVGSGPIVPLFLLVTVAECARLFGPSGLTDPPPETEPVL